MGHLTKSCGKAHAQCGECQPDMRRVRVISAVTRQRISAAAQRRVTEGRHPRGYHWSQATSRRVGKLRRANSRFLAAARQNLVKAREALMSKVGVHLISRNGFDCAVLWRWREAVLERDGHRCVRCGSVEWLEADHIVLKTEDPSLAYVLLNGRTLCRKCHVKVTRFGPRLRMWEAAQLPLPVVL